MDDYRFPPGLSLLRLRVFAAVAEQGGYSAAARGLALSQSTVSFHVQALERAFGTSLLTYRGRRVHLTAAGEALYAVARRTLCDAEALTAQVASLRAGHAGRVRLGASIAFEQAFFFSTVIAPFARARPGIEISLRFGTSLQMAEAVRAREADLAYVMHCHLPPDVRYLPLHTSRAAFFVAEDHPLAAQRPTADEVGAAGLIAATVSHAAEVPVQVTAGLLIGVDLGPNLSVTGSLATILWLVALRREAIEVSAWRFLKIGWLVMFPALILALAALGI